MTMGIAIAGGLFGGWAVSTFNIFKQEPLMVAEVR